MKAVMLDLVRSDSGQKGNPRESAIDRVAVEVREPMGYLEPEVVEKRSEQESHRRAEGEDGRQESVVSS